MHGLINRAIQCFLRDTYGADVWARIMQEADLGYDSFESMLIYEESVTFQIIDIAVAELRKSKDDLLEDLGTYLVSHDNVRALRRLLRFGGLNFNDFLHSLDDLQDRARLAVPDLYIPSLQVDEVQPGEFRVESDDYYPGFGHVMVGIIRGMADDYGALAFTNIISQAQDGGATISITLLDEDFAMGRSFELAQKAG